MKYTLLSLLLISSIAFGQTVILYGDGSTYTLEPTEEIYVSDKGVYSARGGLKTWLRIIRMEPNQERDYVQPEPVAPVPCTGQLTFGGACFDEPEEEEEVYDGDFTFGG
jgi:hypothetical protein